jgi:hypothetical protein
MLFDKNLLQRHHDNDGVGRNHDRQKTESYSRHLAYFPADRSPYMF